MFHPSRERCPGLALRNAALKHNRAAGAIQQLVVVLLIAVHGRPGVAVVGRHRAHLRAVVALGSERRVSPLVRNAVRSIFQGKGQLGIVINVVISASILNFGSEACFKTIDELV